MGYLSSRLLVTQDQFLGKAQFLACRLEAGFVLRYTLSKFL